MRGQRNINFVASVDDRVMRLSVSGELDLLTGPAFASLLRQLKHDYPQVRLDLSNLEFMDAAGLHALERVTTGSGDWLQIEREVQPQVRRMLKLTDSERLLSLAGQMPGVISQAG